MAFKKPLRTKYHCKHCGRTVIRDSEKAWIKSYCDDTGRWVHLMRVAQPLETKG